MAIMISALVMAAAMMIAAVQSVRSETRREAFRALQRASIRGRFAD